MPNYKGRKLHAWSVSAVCKQPVNAPFSISLLSLITIISLYTGDWRCVWVCVSLLKQRTKQRERERERESLGVRSSCSCHSNTAKNMGGRGGRWGDSWVMGVCVCVCVYACTWAWMYDYPPADTALWCWSHQGPPCWSPSWGPDPNPAACHTQKHTFWFYPSNPIPPRLL